jgi:hypothetical protein
MRERERGFVSFTAKASRRERATSGVSAAVSVTELPPSTGLPLGAANTRGLPTDRGEELCAVKVSGALFPAVAKHSGGRSSGGTCARSGGDSDSGGEEIIDGGEAWPPNSAPPSKAAPGPGKPVVVCAGTPKPLSLDPVPGIMPTPPSTPCEVTDPKLHGGVVKAAGGRAVSVSGTVRMGSGGSQAPCVGCSWANSGARRAATSRSLIRVIRVIRVIRGLLGLLGSLGLLGGY